MTRLVQLGIIGLPNASLFSHMKTTSSATENEITAKKIFKNKHSGKNTIVVTFKDESTTKAILTQKKNVQTKKHLCERKSYSQASFSHWSFNFSVDQKNISHSYLNLCCPQDFTIFDKKYDSKEAVNRRGK